LCVTDEHLLVSFYFCLSKDAFGGVTLFVCNECAFFGVANAQFNSIKMHEISTVKIVMLSVWKNLSLE
jgi:hypothetical protein